MEHRSCPGTTVIHPQTRGPFRSLSRSRICCVLFSTFVEQISREKGTKEYCNEGGKNSPDKPLVLGAGRSRRKARIPLVTGKSNYMVSRWKYLPQKLEQRLTAKIGTEAESPREDCNLFLISQ